MANFFSSVVGNFEDIVQYNKVNRHFEGVHRKVTIDTLCDVMTDENAGSALARLAKVNQVILDMEGEKCLSYKYEDMISEVKVYIMKELP